MPSSSSDITMTVFIELQLLHCHYSSVGSKTGKLAGAGHHEPSDSK